MSQKKTTRPQGQTIAKDPKTKVRPRQPGKNSEFTPVAEDIAVMFSELATVLDKSDGLISRHAKVLQIVFSSEGSGARVVTEMATVLENIRKHHEEVDMSSFALWSYWTYDKGYHTALLMIDVSQTSMSKTEQLSLLGHVRSSTNKNLKKTVADKHFVIITEVVNCAAFASVFIEAREPGYLFIGFNPSDKRDDISGGQWTVLAPAGSYVPSCYNYEHDKGRQYFPLYAMRAFHDAKLPAAKLGFEPPANIARLRQETSFKGSPGYDDSSPFWDELPPDDDDNDDSNGSQDPEPPNDPDDNPGQATGGREGRVQQGKYDGTIRPALNDNRRHVDPNVFSAGPPPIGLPGDGRGVSRHTYNIGDEIFRNRVRPSRGQVTHDHLPHSEWGDTADPPRDIVASTRHILRQSSENDGQITGVRASSAVVDRDIISTPERQDDGARETTRTDFQSSREHVEEVHPPASSQRGTPSSRSTQADLCVDSIDSDSDTYSSRPGDRLSSSETRSSPVLPGPSARLTFTNHGQSNSGIAIERTRGDQRQDPRGAVEPSDDAFAVSSSSQQTVSIPIPRPEMAIGQNAAEADLAFAVVRVSRGRGFQSSREHVEVAHLPASSQRDTPSSGLTQTDTGTDNDSDTDSSGHTGEPSDRLSSVETRPSPISPGPSVRLTFTNHGHSSANVVIERTRGEQRGYPSADVEPTDDAFEVPSSSQQTVSIPIPRAVGQNAADADRAFAVVRVSRGRGQQSTGGP